MPDPPTQPQDGPLAPGTVVAGYRLLRQLPGHAQRETWLARSLGREETLCVTVQRPTEALDRQVAVHSRVTHHTFWR